MNLRLDNWRRSLPVAVSLVAFGLTLALRVDSIGSRFWLLRDQIRDWSIALGAFGDLPLVGPPTHVGGYTIGPAFYWILWAIRITFGPWFENLPHAGGIGQAVLQSAADALLLVAIWRRTGSWPMALTATVLIATASFDLCLAALVWNPTMGSALAKTAVALVLLNWHLRSPAHAAGLALVAWSAVHAYTGAIFATVGIFAAMMADPLIRREWRTLRRNAIVAALAVAFLQLPYAAHQLSRGFRDQAMGAVTGSVGQVLSGQARPELTKSLAGYAAAVDFIQTSPWQIPFVAPVNRSRVVGSVLLLCNAIVALRYRRDPAILGTTVVPQALAIIGYALFLDDLDHYYYLSLMPAAVLTCLLAVAAVPHRRIVLGLNIVLLAGALALVPARIQFARTMHSMPEYRLLVEGSRKVRSVRQPMRAIRTDFTLPPTADPEFLYRVLGGQIDPASPWTAIILSDGRVVYRNAGGS